MIDLIERFKEFAEGLRLSDYELFYWTAVLASYPKTTHESCFDIDSDNTVYSVVKKHDCEHKLTIGASYITYVNNEFVHFQSGEDGHTEYSVIAKFFKAIQNG